MILRALAYDNNLFALRDERFNLGRGHRGEVVNVESAILAEPGAIVAFHFVPVGRTRRSDAELKGHGPPL